MNNTKGRKASHMLLQQKPLACADLAPLSNPSFKSFSLGEGKEDVCVQQLDKGL